MTEAFEFSLDDKVLKPDALSLPEQIILYGPAGSGKTFLAASAAEVEGLFPVLIIDTEGSTSGTLKNLPQDRIDIVRPQVQYPGKEYAATVKILEELLSKSHKYKTVIIDTADVLQEWSIMAGRTKGDGFAHWNFTHSELTAPPGYNSTTGTRDRGLFHRLKSADFLSILVIHEKKEALNEEGTLTYSDIQWQGQGKTKLPGIPDMVGYVTRDTNSGGISKSTLQVAPTKRNLAKNRFDLPAKIENPTMKSLWSLIQNDNTEEK